MLKIGSNINEVRVDGSLKALQRDLNAFAGFGLTAAEISIHGLDAVRNGRLDRRRTAEIKTILADYPFRLQHPCPQSAESHGPATAPDMHRDVLLASLEFTAAIGASCMVYHPGRYLVEEEFGIRGPLVASRRGTTERLLDQEAEILQEAADCLSRGDHRHGERPPLPAPFALLLCRDAHELARQIRADQPRQCADDPRFRPSPSVGALLRAWMMVAEVRGRAALDRPLPRP